MSFYGALFVWFIIAAILVSGVVLAVKVSVAFLVVPLLVFMFLFGKYGCAIH